MNHSVILNKYVSILSELREVIQNTEFSVNNFSDQKKPDDFNFSWKSSPRTVNHLPPSYKPSITELSRNLTCKKCINRISAIRGFIHTGKIPLLVLHYTGEISPTKKVFSKTGKNQIFRDLMQEELFERMIQKIFSVTMKDLFYQEFPGCNFNNYNSKNEDWLQRSNNCLEHVNLTIKSYNIKGIIITGRAAVSYYGFEKAEELLEKIFPFELNGNNIPCIVIRSPEKILSLEEKKRKLENSRDSIEYKKTIEEERIIKLQIVNSLTDFKNRIFP